MNEDLTNKMHLGKSFRTLETFVAILLTKQQWTLIDYEDHEKVRKHRWYASLESRRTKYYAIRWTSPLPRKKIRLHHFVLGITPSDLNGEVIDHIYGDSLDNRKACLERITQQQNMQRSPGWKKKKVIEPCL